MMDKEKEQYEKMVNTPIRKLVLKLAIPTIISMLVTSIYNLADTLFVSSLGESVSGAISVVFPIMTIIQAVGFTLGMGAGSLISAKLGKEENGEAKSIGSISFYTSIVLGFLILMFGLIFLVPLLNNILGATETIFPHAKQYAFYILLGSPIMTASFVLNNILRSEGKSKFAMIGLVTGGIINILLDPLFIFAFNMGISGAAIATITSQTISFILLLIPFLRGKTIVDLSFKKITKYFSSLFEIVRTGFPSLARQGLATLSTILMNNVAGNIGNDAGVSAMGIVTKVFMVIFAITLGIGQGYQPVCGYNYFSKNYKRVKEAMIFTFVFSLVCMSGIAVIVYFTAPYLIDIFIDSGQVVEIGKIALRYQCLVMPLIPFNVICNMTYQATRKKVRATLLSICRQGIFYIPLILLLPKYFGLLGLEISQPIADVLTSLFSVPFFISIIKRLNKEIEI
ncbi:MAG: MATE family efflux transporter [Bacilli bacterium]